MGFSSKYKIQFCLLLCALFSAGGVAQDSAYRHPNKSFRDYVHPGVSGQIGIASAYDQAQPYFALNFEDIPELFSREDLQQYFQYIRDLRFLVDPEVEGFWRRSSWLYPDDGCFARAQLANHNLKEASVLVPYKVFIFGDLEVDTDNSPNGRVSWWFHVAPIVRVSDDVFVLDPAIQSRMPMRLVDWIHTMAPDLESVTLSFCSPGTYLPQDDCQREGISVERALESQSEYLAYERLRLIELQRDPESELGESPPWLEFHGR